MTQWFIKRSDDGGEEGPLRPAQLLLRVRAGEVTRTTQIRKNDSNWFEADQVGGLFEAALRPTIDYLCPNCESDINEPPTQCPQCGREIYRAVERITENSIATPASTHGRIGSAKKSVSEWLRRKGVDRSE